MFADGRLPKPKLLFVGVDPWWLSYGRERATWLDDASLQDATYQLSGHFHAIKNSARSWFNGGQGFEDDGGSMGYRPVGLHAARGNGFRSDGSRLYGHALRDYDRDPRFRDREHPPIVERVRHGLAQFSPSDGLDPSRVERLIAALTSIQGQGIEVYVLLMPASGETATALRESEGLSRWWAEMNTDLPDALRAAGVFGSVTETPADCGMDDRAMFDGFHPSEVLNACVLRRAVEGAPEGSILAGLDDDYLMDLQSSAASPLELRAR